MLASSLRLRRPAASRHGPAGQAGLSCRAGSHWDAGVPGQPARGTCLALMIFQKGFELRCLPGGHPPDSSPRTCEGSLASGRGAFAAYHPEEPVLLMKRRSPAGRLRLAACRLHGSGRREHPLGGPASGVRVTASRPERETETPIG